MRASLEGLGRTRPETGHLIGGRPGTALPPARRYAFSERSHPAGTSCGPGDGQMVFTYREGCIGDSLLDISSLDKREILLDLLQGPARAYQAQQMFNRETMPPDARLATHLARLDGDAVKTFHTANLPLHRRHPARTQIRSRTTPPRESGIPVLALERRRQLVRAAEPRRPPGADPSSAPRPASARSPPSARTPRQLNRPALPRPRGARRHRRPLVALRRPGSRCRPHRQAGGPRGYRGERLLHGSKFSALWRRCPTERCCWSWTTFMDSRAPNLSRTSPA
jgi:hypothetical protein